MLLCGINEIEPGVTVVASVMHPARAETELVRPGLVLDADLLNRLRDFGVERVWIDHDATADLDTKVPPLKSPAHQKVCDKLKDRLRESAAATVSVGDVASYRQAVLDLICELMGNPALAMLADRMSHCNEGELFRHAANVAYLSILIGLQMETYIIQQRPKLTPQNAKDLTALGMGAMLHDIGKIAEPSPEPRALNALAAHRAAQAIDPADTDAAQQLSANRQQYETHCEVGYRLLEMANAPASARQVVLSHHQRWDGTGFPAMDKITHGRKQGTQQREGIHIFSRIVAAADLFDHLLQEAKAKQKPVIAALSAFRDKAFEPWLDPIIRDAVLRCVPPFPVASKVTLNDGRAAVVIAPNPVQPCLPVLRLLDAGDAAASEPLALAEHRDLTITHHLGEPIADDIFLLPEREPLAKTLARAG